MGANTRVLVRELGDSVALLNLEGRRHLKASEDEFSVLRAEVFVTFSTV
jgi:hypothetical protein